MRDVFRTNFSEETKAAMEKIKCEKEEKLNALIQKVQILRDKIGKLQAENELYNQLILRKVNGSTEKLERNDKLLTKTYNEFDELKSSLRTEINNLQSEIEIIDELMKL